MTNEEWIRSASADELAQFLADSCCDAVYYHETHKVVGRIYKPYWDCWLNETHKENDHGKRN